MLHGYSKLRVVKLRLVVIFGNIPRSNFDSSWIQKPRASWPFFIKSSFYNAWEIRTNLTDIIEGSSTSRWSGIARTSLQPIFWFVLIDLHLYCFRVEVYCFRPLPIVFVANQKQRCKRCVLARWSGKDPALFSEWTKTGPDQESDRESHCLNIEHMINLFIYIFIIYKQENSWNMDAHKLQRWEIKDNYRRRHVSVVDSSVCFLLPVCIEVRIRRRGCIWTAYRQRERTHLGGNSATANETKL